MYIIDRIHLSTFQFAFKKTIQMRRIVYSPVLTHDTSNMLKIKQEKESLSENIYMRTLFHVILPYLTVH